MKFILGTKIEMSQVFRADGTVVPVTRVLAGPCTVTQVKANAKSGVFGVQVGMGEQKAFRIPKPEQGHLKGLPMLRTLRDFRTPDENHGLKRGDRFTVSIFTPGDKVVVVGTAKGRGFQGVVKRHGFHGSPATHGHKDQLRMPGSIGAGGVQRVFKGMRMAGHMGDNRVTVKNLEIVEILPETNELLIKGAVPGARGSLLLISTEEGVMKIEEVATSSENQNDTRRKGEMEESVSTESVSEEAAPALSEEPAAEPAPTEGEAESQEEKA